MTLLLLLVACGPDRPPVLDPIGDLQDVGFDVEVSLRAKTRDPEDEPLRWEWTQTLGPRVALDGARTGTVRFRTRALRERAGAIDRFGAVAIPTRAADVYGLRVRVRAGNGSAEREVRVRAGSPSPGWPRVETGHALELSCGRSGGAGRWKLVEQPAASHGTIEDGDLCRARLRPGRPGRYRLEEDGRPLVVHAGGWTGATECARSDCHGAIGASWRATKHAKVGREALESRGVQAVLYEAAGVQCEHCHGPGRFWTGYRAQVCGTCHAAREEDRWVEAWSRSAMSHAPDGEKAEAPCASCHAAYAAVARFDGHAPVAPREEPKDEGVTCAVCHDPHDATNTNQLRVAGRAQVGTKHIAAGSGAICFACHGGDASAWAQDARRGVAPHAPQGWMVSAGAHVDVEGSCIGCHMRGGDGLEVGGHTFLARSGEATNLVPCRPCHERPSEDLRRVQDEIERGTAALRTALRDALAARGVRGCDGVLAAGVVRAAGRIVAADARGHAMAGCDGEVQMPEGLRVAGAALLLVEGDGSRGVHDAGVARAVIRVGRTALRE